MICPLALQDVQEGRIQNYVVCGEAEEVILEILEKKHEGKKLSTDEKHKYDRAWKVSSLVENFGKIAITVMSGYGVGADTAARILRNMVDEEHLFKQIYEAERQYVVTRGFWDS